MSRTSATHWVKITQQVRKNGQQNNTPCHLCNGSLGPIDYRTQAEADRDARRTGNYWETKAHRPLALHVDHITPHSAGGTDTLDNAAPTHAICNTKAGAKGNKRTTKPQPLNGFWWPHNNSGQPLPGRAIPGTTTPTHTFHAG